MDLCRIGSFLRWSALVVAFLGLYFAAPMVNSGFEAKHCRSEARAATMNDDHSLSARCRELRGGIALGVALIGCSVLLGGLGKKLRNRGQQRRSGQSD
jgi:hypothetical protein